MLENKTRSYKKLYAFVSFSFLIFGFCFIFYRHWQLVTSTPVNSWLKSEQADCAVVLTGGPGRVREGFDLLSERKVKKLIISGVNPDVRLRELVPHWIFHPSLKTEDIILEKRSETTWGNAQQSLPLVEALRCRDILLVSSALHMNRAYRTFRASFPDSIQIKPWSVVSVSSKNDPVEVFWEVIKSLFYSFWAY